MIKGALNVAHNSFKRCIPCVHLLVHAYVDKLVIHHMIYLVL